MTDTKNFDEWTAAVTDQVAELLQVGVSDAQALVETHTFELDNEWCKGSPVEETAQLIASIER